MISTKKHGVGFKDRLGQLSLQGASRSKLAVLTETRRARILIRMVMH
jgi:hypothetical protein